MKHNEALERLQEIQRIAERTTLYTQLPGLAAIIGGLLAWIGCALSFFLMHSFDFGTLVQLSPSHQLFFVLMWTGIGLIAVIQEVIFTTHDAKKQGIEPLSRPGKLSAYSLTPSVLVALVISLKLFLDAGTSEAAIQNVRYLAPLWMMCYGTGIYAAGLFSIRLPRMLGLAFIITGAAGLIYFENYGLLLVALSFGLLHIIFGIIVITKAKRRQQA